MKRASTIFLRVVVWLLALVVLAICVFALPAGLRAENVGGYRPILIGMYLTAVPFFLALFHVLKLLDYIDRGHAFSQDSVKALKAIKSYAFIISALYAAGLPYIFYVADQDDAPGVVLMALVCIFGPLAVAVFAGVFQQIFQAAITIKSENDLTV